MAIGTALTGNAKTNKERIAKMDRENVIAWLTEISLRPCDFTRDDFDAYETEHLASKAIEICEDAKVFNQQRNDALSLLKEQEPVEVIHHEAPYGYPFNTGKCPVCFQQLDEGDKFCRECGQAVKWNA